MKKSFLYIGFLGMGLFAGNSVMAQVAGKQQSTVNRATVPRNVKPVENVSKVRAVTPEAAKASVANATRQPQTQTPAAAQPAATTGPVTQQKTQGKAGYSEK